MFSQSDYEKECNEKLLHIKDTRQRQAAVAIQGGMMAGGMQNQMQGGLPPQMGRGMQTSPVPGQPQMAVNMGMNDPNQQAMMQQRQQQQTAMLQQQQQQQQQAQRAQQRPGNAALPDDLNNLSPQEHDHVTRLANQMLAKTSKEDMEKIRVNLSNMNPEQRQYLTRKNMEPMQYFFRSQALNQLRRHKRAKELGRTPNANVDPNSAMMGDPAMMNQHQRQMFQSMMNLQRNNGFPGNPGQGLDPNVFIGNVENIQGQQADGLRSQEAGQLVVPASSSQMNQAPFPNNQQNMFQQQMGQNGQANMNGAGVEPQMFNPQQVQQTGSNGPQGRMQFQNQQPQQSQQAQAAAAQAQARAQAAQKAQMAMSGQNTQAQSHIGQGSPAMNILNQPMAPGQMSPVQMPNQSRPPSRTPNMGQHPGGVPGGAQPTMQGRPQIPPNLPQAVQEQLNAMSNEQLHAFLLNQRRAALANNMQRQNNGAQQSGPIPQNMAQAGQTQGIFNGQMGNNPRLRNSISMQQGMNAAGPQQLPNGQQMTPQQQMHRAQQNDMSRFQMLRPQNTGIEMNPDQVNQMDRATFPQSLLTNNSQVPKHIKTWGQLKQWVASSPQASTGIDLNKLMTLQKLHFAQIISVHAKDQNGQAQGQGILANPFQTGPQGQAKNGQNVPGGQTANMPPMRPITAQDIHMARQRLGPQSPQYSDDQIREILRNRQRQILIQTAHQRAQAQAHMNTNVAPGQTQPPAQPQVSVPQNTQQAKQPSMPQPQTTGGETPASTAAKSQAGAPGGKGPKAAAAKQNSKKRPSTDDTGAAAAAVAQQAQATATPTNTQRAPAPFSQEQFAAMSPQQRLQIEAHMRRQQQSQLRGPILNRAAAEEAWNNNLPPKIMEAYNEISKNAPPAQPVPISPDQKAVMTQQLRDSLDVLGRLDVLVLHGFAKMQDQERKIKNLLAMRIQLMRQFKPSQEWVVNDQFTITPDYLTGAILFIRKLFQVMIVRMNQARAPNGNQAQAATGANQPSQGSTPQLNASNLQQLQQQQEEALNARRASNSNQSVTHPPAPFGAPSPSGVPHAYGPGALVPEKLKLPPPKKRKQSHAGPNASPVQSSAAPAAAAKYKQAVADAKTTAAALAGAFKCSVVECQFHFQGFPTQAALDQHVEEDHQPEEDNIEDPLQFYLDSVSMGLGLDASGQPVKPNVTAAPASNLNKPSIASPAKHGLATPVTANATPMARATSQLGTKGASPATPAQQLTPSQSAKNLKPSPGKDSQKQVVNEDEFKDAWADCPMSLGTVHDSFAPLFSECRRRGNGYDAFDEFLNTDMFTQDQTEDTPDSWDVALATLTPKDEDPKVDVRDGVTWADWMPWDEETTQATADWMNIPSEILLKDGPDLIPGVQVDWESLERQQKDSTSFGPLPIAPTA